LITADKKMLRRLLRLIEEARQMLRQWSGNLADRCMVAESALRAPPAEGSHPAGPTVGVGLGVVVAVARAVASL
jgi:hypothetical protein